MSSETATTVGSHDDIIYPDSIAFLFVHLACFGILWTGITTASLVLAVTLYVARMIIITAGYHRYFSHKSFRTSRFGQFLLAALSQTSGQRGAVWWAAKHREHHKYSDTELDVHSPGQQGFFFAHVGWVFSRSRQEADFSTVPDLTRYPELMWLNRYHKVPMIALAAGCYLIGGWPGLFVGFFASTVVLYHCTFFINSLAHVVGNQRYVTGDDSRNNWWLALITMGEGWHNNHHHFPASTRQGFRWWEIDVTFYVLKALSWTGLVWDLKSPPPSVVRGERPLPRPVVEKVALQLASTFKTEALAAHLHAAWTEHPRFEDLRLHAAEKRAHLEAAIAQWSTAESWPRLEALKERFDHARAQAAARIAEFHLPELPSFEEVSTRAREMYAASPSLDDIVARARELIMERISAELLGPIPALPART